MLSGVQFKTPILAVSLEKSSIVSFFDIGLNIDATFLGLLRELLVLSLISSNSFHLQSDSKSYSNSFPQNGMNKVRIYIF
jgi:hypothetical protein